MWKLTDRGKRGARFPQSLENSRGRSFPQLPHLLTLKSLRLRRDVEIDGPWKTRGAFPTILGKLQRTEFPTTPTSLTLQSNIYIFFFFKFKTMRLRRSGLCAFGVLKALTSSAPVSQAVLFNVRMTCVTSVRMICYLLSGCHADTVRMPCEFLSGSMRIRIIYLRSSCDSSFIKKRKHFTLLFPCRCSHAASHNIFDSFSFIF